jgi:hypothetical protein
MIRNTDVKKHLGRAVPRPVSTPAQNGNTPTDGDGAPQGIPATVMIESPEKVENA